MVNISDCSGWYSLPQEAVLQSHNYFQGRHTAGVQVVVWITMIALISLRTIISLTILTSLTSLATLTALTTLTTLVVLVILMNPISMY